MKQCKIIDAVYCYILEVDGKRIMIQYSDEIDYFEEHYRSLGYEVTRHTQE